MKTKTLLLLVITALCLNLSAMGQKEEKSIEGWNVGILPAIAFDSDLGFRYGALIKPINYGRPTVYPAYKHMLYAEWSHTTKGSDLKQFKFDSEYLIPGIRVTAVARLENEQAADFYGFNGYEGFYSPNVVDTTSRMFYKTDRQSLRLITDFQGPIIGRTLRWFGGLGHYRVNLGPVDIAKLNEGKEEADQLPDIDGLYQNYVDWGVIPSEQADGGNVTMVKAGLVADTRDNEPNPNQGIWTEAFLIASPGFIGNKSPYTALVVTHRQYFTIFPDRLTFAYRLNYQSTLTGSTPWYMLSFRQSTYNNVGEGLGGTYNLRGVLRNRILAEGSLGGNFEFRWKFLKFQVAGQNIYLALSPFVDMARVTRRYEYTEVPQMLQGDKDGFHWSYGAGLHIAMNQNFIVAVDYGLAADKRDGKSGLYIGLDFLF